jgi:RNA polymerase sigma factor FliA
MALTDPAAGAMVYKRKPEVQSPEAIARAHMPLVRKIAWHVHGRVSTAIEVEDLIQIGMIALVEAANGYEDRGHAFATYATMRIRGAMIDHLRRQATLCRSAMARRRDFTAARVKLEQRLGREASEAELAVELGLDPAEFRRQWDEAQAVRHESIDEVYSEHSMWFADLGEGAEQALQREGLQEALAGAIRQLPEREAMVLQLYFVEEMNLEEIGLTLGIGAARVCQIKKAALEKVRGLLSEWE